ncbi:MAG: glycoside hydrolase family 3 C-terminal domain-containing protein [Anaerolineaceae bacterium]|nr:glycoside hydrolase family 3 C-terminal domain-containing protein [Anaerolineaceae bacterium]
MSLINTLTLEQKARLCVGMNFWMTQGYPEVDLPSLFMSDGPHGLRKQDLKASDHLGLNDSQSSVCYPTGSLAACSWDRELLFQLGDSLGQEAGQLGVDMLLGPAINIKRSPLCGRNFEYYSEDPYLAGQLAAAFVKGVQGNKVSACPKHFTANNQETRRKAVDTIVDERTLREIYLPAFEAALKEGGAWAVMSSYNKINGSYPAEHPHLATEILRGEWGFEGTYVTDWGAMDQIVPSIRAGLTLQMPGDGGNAAQKLIAAVENGSLAMADLDRAVAGLLYTLARVQGREKATTTSAAYHRLAYQIALESMVLLKNQAGILPLAPGARVGVVGEMAEKPRYQGSGSSHVNPYRLVCALEEMKAICPHLRYARGYADEVVTPAMAQEALRVAQNSDVVVVFAGLPASYESEAYDRTDMRMPDAHNRLIVELAQANPNLVVVLSNGSAVEMPWLAHARGVLEAYLGGEAGGAAVSDLLFGRANPCGKLAETFPVQLEDNPAYLNFPGEGDRVEYREGLFVGYRYYEKKNRPPAFAFGHGLSYTTFAYSDLALDRAEMDDTHTLTVRCRVKNTGDRAGKEIVQLYVRDLESPVIRPVKELKEFAKVSLAPGEEKEITFRLGRRAFAYYHTGLGDWHVHSGEYEICIAAAADDVRLSQVVQVRATVPLKVTVTRNTLLMDILADPILEAAFQPLYEGIKPYLPFNLNQKDIKTDKLARSMLNNMTLNSLASYVGSQLNDGVLEEIIRRLNAAQAS